MNSLFSTIVLAQEADPSAGGGGFGMFPFLILMLIMMYFLTIRPQRKKQKELQTQIDAMKTGDKIVTAGGLHGLITNIKERTVMIKVADNVKLEFEKSSVATVIKKDQPAGEKTAELTDEKDSAASAE